MTAILDAIGLGFVYRFLKDIFGVGFRWWKGTPPEKKIEMRQKWKPRFEEHIRKNHQEGLRYDVIIRDVQRIDDYPDLQDKRRGISPWFRLGLVGTYHRGIYVAFQWTKIVQVGEGNFRHLDYENDDDKTKENALKVIQLGLIPFENIEEVDFEGDEYYSYPHIYCHFTIKRQPYERIAYFTEGQLFPDSLPNYTEIAEAEKVRALSKSMGVKSPFA